MNNIVGKDWTKLAFILFYSLIFSSNSIYAEEPWQISKNSCVKKNEHHPISTALIHFYQDVISPIDGPRSHFRPSSSSYMLNAIHRWGFFSGVVIGCDRLLRENSDPWIYDTVDFDSIRLKWDPVDGKDPFSSSESIH